MSNDFTADNYGSSVKAKGNLRVFISITPDFYEVIEQEIPRSEKQFNSVEDAIVYANDKYHDWQIITPAETGFQLEQGS